MRDQESSSIRQVRASARGVTLTEILIVAALSSVVLGGAFLLMRGTTRTFKKTTDLMNVQTMMNKILSLMRTDVRNLKTIVKAEDHSVVFTGTWKGKDARIEYSFTPEVKLLVRAVYVDGAEPQYDDFDPSTKIEGLVFKVQTTPQKEFQYLDVALRLKSNEAGEGRASFLTFFCRCYSKCGSLYNPFVGGGAAP